MEGDYNKHNITKINLVKSKIILQNIIKKQSN